MLYPRRRLRLTRHLRLIALFVLVLLLYIILRPGKDVRSLFSTNTSRQTAKPPPGSLPETGNDPTWSGSEGRSLQNFGGVPLINLTSLSGIPVAEKEEAFEHEPGFPNKTLVIAAQERDDVSWAEAALPGWRKMVYITDRQGPSRGEQSLLRSSLVVKTTPINKGNEVMAYLSYIIDQYDKLPKITVFVHHHRLGWHNNDLLNFDIVEVVERLILSRVVELGGYANLRCHWDPGCPASLLSSSPSSGAPSRQDVQRKLPGEEAAIAKAWETIFPSSDPTHFALPMPSLLAQPCCSQFAVSRDRIQAVPLDHWIRIRQWVTTTDLPDYMSGRVFEHIWHTLLLPNNPAVACHSMYVCYCALYGMCFQSEQHFRHWFEIRSQLRRYDDALAGHRPAEHPLPDHRFEQAVQNGEVDPFSVLDRLRWLRQECAALVRFLDEQRREALFRGLDRDFRSLVGRSSGG